MKSRFIKLFILLVLLNFTINTTSAIDLDQPSGTISVVGGDYTDNIYMEWNINTGLNHTITVNYYVEIEEGYDFVEIYDVDINGNVSATPIISQSGYGEGSITTTIPSGRAKIIFITDGSVNFSDGHYGFDLSYFIDNTTSSFENVSVSGNLNVARDIQVGSNYKIQLMEFPGQAMWIDMPIGKASGIGSGGPGQNAWISQAMGANQWFMGASYGDVCYRNLNGKLLFGNTSGNPTMTIYQNKIGIGTLNPDELLTVKGKVHAQEVIIDLNGPLADFVFSPDYTLMPLPKVEAFVKQNKHLPEIPSAAEVKEKGLSMGEMQNKLLQKIEELTLYVIEQQKRIELLEKGRK